MLPCCDGPACFYQSSPELPGSEGIGLGSKGEAAGIEKISLVDSFTGVLATIEPERPATLWRFPLYTVSLSEEGFEKIYQGSCLLFLFPVEFTDDEMVVGFRVKVEGVTAS
jgi:alpha-amylase